MSAEIIVGTLNSSKIAGFRRACEKLVWPAVGVIEGQEVASGVAQLPVGEEACLAGARNRAKQCLVAQPDALLGIGIESGLRAMPEDTLAMTTYVYVCHREGASGFASSSSHPVLRGEQCRKVLAGELDPVTLFPAGQQSISQLTGGAYTLSEKVFEASICALAVLRWQIGQ